MTRKRNSPKGARDKETTSPPGNNNATAAASTASTPATHQQKTAFLPPNQSTYSTPSASNLQSPSKEHFFSPSNNNNTTNLGGSAPDLTGDIGDEDLLSPQVTHRLKRTYQEFRDDDLSSFMQEMRNSMFNSNLLQEKKFNTMQASLKAISDQNMAIQTSITFISTQYDELMKKINMHEAERQIHIQKIATLENKVDSLERQIKATSIEVRNIPFKPTEKKEDLTILIKNIGTELDVHLEEMVIKDVFRTTTKNPTNKPIIVEFISSFTKDKVLTSMKQYKQAHKNLMTNKLGVEGPSVPVYISENLTSKNKRLFALARELAKQHGYKYCWSSHGSVYLRRADGDNVTRINSDQDLEEIKKHV
ncbi:hypothetical protein NE865_09650 [Phthorimaea operculella]|nr:hypothetical protein NE865_09650 [Phthorimaea operculella]